MKRIIAGLLVLLYRYRSTVFRKSFGLKLQGKSKHFIFYSSDKDKSCINNICDLIEDFFDNETKRFHVYPKRRIPIEIYPGISEFHNAIGQPEAPNWVIGISSLKIIKIVSPLNPGERHTYNTIISSIPHELVHTLVEYLNPDTGSIPFYLNEGLAAYETYKISEEGKQGIKSLVLQKKIPMISEISYDNLDLVGGHDICFTIVEYMISKSSLQAVLEAIRRPRKMFDIMKMTEEEFQLGWLCFLNMKYVNI